MSKCIRPFFRTVPRSEVPSEVQILDQLGNVMGYAVRAESGMYLPRDSNGKYLLHDGWLQSDPFFPRIISLQTPCAVGYETIEECVDLIWLSRIKRG